MARINIYSTSEGFDGPVATLAGWFDPKTSTRFDEGREFDGHNMIGVVTKSQWIDEYLYRTKGGRWVLNRDSTRYHNGPDSYSFITDEDAREWLIQSEINDAAVEKYFGPIEEERGPGRPVVGPAFSLRFPEDLLARLDARAKNEKISRAELIRRLVVAGL